MITLELIQQYGAGGWQDPETGEEFFDHKFTTPYGVLGNVSVKKTDDGWEIRQADQVALFSRGFIESLSNGYEDECTETWVNFFGIRFVAIRADNGHVVYQLFDDELEWSDTGKVADCYLAVQTQGEWDADNS